MSLFLLVTGLTMVQRNIGQVCVCTHLSAGWVQGPESKQTKATVEVGRTPEAVPMVFRAVIPLLGAMAIAVRLSLLTAGARSGWHHQGVTSGHNEPLTMRLSEPKKIKGQSITNRGNTSTKFLRREPDRYG